MKAYYTSNRKNLIALPVIFLASLLFAMALLPGCNAPPKTAPGVTWIAPRGDPPAQSVVWSPTEPNKILVVASQGMGSGPGSVYILDLDTGQRDEIAKIAWGNFTGVVWAPDGKKVMIQSGESTQGFEPPGWWVVNVGDKSVQYLGNYIGASWSPDSTTIAAFSGVQEDGKFVNIRLQLLGRDATMETVYVVEGPGFVSVPVWSPDGKFLAFSYGGGIEPGDLYVFNLQTREATKITDNKLNNQLAWSPQGNIIAVRRSAPDEFNPSLHLISIDGKCDVEIPKVTYPLSPSWSPDGKRLAYVTIDGIYSLDVNTMLGRDIYQGLCQ